MVRRPRILLHELQAGSRVVRGALAHHLRDVLRVRAGTELVAFDGDGLEALGRVVAVERHGVSLELGAPALGVGESTLSVSLAVALLKGDKLADVVRKGTELGVVRVRPFFADRCDVRALSAAKLRRYRRVAEEAARQCGRTVVPEVTEPVRLASLCFDGDALVAVPRADTPVREALARRPAGAVTLITGPEGGLSEDEVASLLARGAGAVRLGPRILRAETAPIALAAAVLVPDGL